MKLKAIYEAINGKIVGKKLKEAGSFQGDHSALSDYLGREMQVETGEDGTIKFTFDSGGWYYDTEDAAEGCAICAGSEKYSKIQELRDIEFTPKAKSSSDIGESLYWISGGNTVWRFGDIEGLNASFDEAKESLMDEYGDDIKSAISSANTLGDLIDSFKEIKDTERFYEWMYNSGLYSDPDEEPETVYTAIGTDENGEAVSFENVESIEALAAQITQHNQKSTHEVDPNSLTITKHEEGEEPRFGDEVDTQELMKVLGTSKYKYGSDPNQGKLNFPENRKKFGSKLSENYKRFFGTPKPIKEKRAIKLSPEQRNRLSNLSRNLARKYPNAPLTIREGNIYFGYKKIEPVAVFLNRSALNITEMVRTFSNSGKKGLV